MNNLKNVINKIFASRLTNAIQQDYNEFVNRQRERERFFKEDCLQRKVLFEKQIPMFCPRTGQINLRYDPEHVAEDFFLTVRAEA